MMLIRVGAEVPGWFAKLDKNEDSLLSQEEAGRFFEPMDADGDGVVTTAEGSIYMANRNLERDPKPDSRGRARSLKFADLEGREKTGKGLWVVSIGHSCVVSAIPSTIQVCQANGFPDHTHVMQFFGGGGGAPKAQWERTGDQQDAKPSLETGKIDVMTFGHLVSASGEVVGCELEDYQRWMEFALQHNPEITFLIQDLWPWIDGTDRKADFTTFNLGDYEAWMEKVTRELGMLVDRLNQLYPGRVRVLPVGPAMVELVKMTLAEELPGVDAVLVPPRDDRGRVGLYRDMIHPTPVAAAMQGYIYYSVLYNRNPVEVESGLHPNPEL
ncbi:MAG: hypothetical protein AAGH89_17585, partial [Verrucomicrobiota bacterium]